MLQPWAIWRRVMRKRNKLQCCAPIVPWHPNSPGTFLANLGQLLRMSFHDFNIFFQAPCAAWSWETTNWLWQRRNKPRRYDQLGPKRIFEWPTHRRQGEPSEQGECWRMGIWKCDLGLGGIRNAFDRFLMMFLVSDSESLWGFAESLCERCFLFFCARGIYFENRQTDMEVYEDSKQKVPETKIARDKKRF